MLPPASCAALLSVVQVENRLGPEAVAVDESVYGPAEAVLASTSAATPAAARVARRMVSSLLELGWTLSRSGHFRSRNPRIASFASSPTIDIASQSRAWPTVSCQEMSRHQLSCCLV